MWDLQKSSTYIDIHVNHICSVASVGLLQNPPRARRLADVVEELVATFLSKTFPEIPQIQAEFAPGAGEGSPVTMFGGRPSHSCWRN